MTRDLELFAEGVAEQVAQIFPGIEVLADPRWSFPDPRVIVTFSLRGNPSVRFIAREAGISVLSPVSAPRITSRQGVFIQSKMIPLREDDLLDEAIVAITDVILKSRNPQHDT